MDQARAGLYNTLLAIVQQNAGDEFNIVLPPRERPDSVSKPLSNGATLVVTLSWRFDAPHVESAELVFPSGNFTLPPDLIRLAAARAPRDEEPEDYWNAPLR